MMRDAAGLRWGLSTGTCAAAAAKASALAARGGGPSFVTVSLPSGETVDLDVISLGEGKYGVVKDAGDDMDATNGVTVTARVTLTSGDGPIILRAGEGVGMVTLPGLKIPPGEPAINPVPRGMIESAVRDVTGPGGADVEISIPGGDALARRTFNGRLGIEGGLSILGTTGRVRPMDKNALFESISLELSTHAARGRRTVLLTFASTGEASAATAWNLPPGRSVQVANEIGFALDECVKLGLRRVVVAGHPGKMLKIAAGCFDTHNRSSDGRFEALCAHIALATGSADHIPEIYSAGTTEAAMSVMNLRFPAKTRVKIWRSLANRAAARCAGRVFGDLDTAAAFTDNKGAVLGESDLFADAIAELTDS